MKVRSKLLRYYPTPIGRMANVHEGSLALEPDTREDLEIIDPCLENPAQTKGPTTEP